MCAACQDVAIKLVLYCLPLLFRVIDHISLSPRRCRTYCTDLKNLLSSLFTTSSLLKCAYLNSSVTPLPGFLSGWINLIIITLNYFYKLTEKQVKKGNVESVRPLKRYESVVESLFSSLENLCVLQRPSFLMLQYTQ